jgi:hypothetical protein
MVSDRVDNRQIGNGFQKRRMASTANIVWPFLVPLSQGLALKAYSYLTSGRTEIKVLNRCVTPTVQLDVVVANPERSPLKSTM